MGRWWKPLQSRGLVLIFKLLLTALTTFLLVETLLLVFNDQIFGDSFYIYDPDLGSRVRPRVEWGVGLRANEFGFNDRDYPLPRWPGTCRVLVLGDSFSWAEGPQGNYTAILEEMLAQQKGPDRVEVVNAGYGGTHTAEQLLLLRKYGLRVRPDAVLLAFFVGNDFVDGDPGRRTLIYGGNFISIDPRSEGEWIVFGQPLLWRSRLLAFRRWRWRYFSKVPEPEMTGPESRVPRFSLSEQDYLRYGYGRMHFAKRGSEGVYTERVAHILAAIEEMRALLKERRIDFMIAFLPDEFQVDPDLRRTLLKEYEEEDSDYDWDRGQDLLRDYAVAHGVGFIDLLPAFVEAHRRGDRLYHPSDTHWNAAGNQLAAETLFDPVLGICRSRVQ